MRAFFLLPYNYWHIIPVFVHKHNTALVATARLLSCGNPLLPPRYRTIAFGELAKKRLDSCRVVIKQKKLILLYEPQLQIS